MDRSWFVQTFGEIAGPRLFEHNDLGRLFPKRQCAAGCDRPCCQSHVPGAEVNLFDLMILAATQVMGYAEFFDQYVELSATPVWRDKIIPMPHHWRIGWRLKRPCPFLGAGGDCRLEQVKPFSCRAFPGAYRSFASEGGKIDAAIAKLRPLGFACEFPDHQNDAFMAGSLGHLRKVAAQETFLSDLFFFMQTPLVINVLPHFDEVRKASKHAGDVDSDFDEGRGTMGYAENHLLISPGGVREILLAYYEPDLRDEALARLAAIESPVRAGKIFSLIEKWREEIGSQGPDRNTVYSVDVVVEGLIKTPLWESGG